MPYCRKVFHPSPGTGVFFIPFRLKGMRTVRHGLFVRVFDGSQNKRAHFNQRFPLCNVIVE